MKGYIPAEDALAVVVDAVIVAPANAVVGHHLLSVLPAVNPPLDQVNVPGKVAEEPNVKVLLVVPKSMLPLVIVKILFAVA